MGRGDTKAPNAMSALIEAGLRDDDPGVATFWGIVKKHQHIVSMGAPTGPITPPQASINGGLRVGPGSNGVNETP